MTTKEERKQKLKNRTRRGVDERGQKGLSKKTALDYGKANGKVIPYDMAAEKGKTRLVDIIPFVVTQSWYKDLRTKSGSPTELEIGDWDYKLEIPVHKNVGPDNKTFLCLQQAFGRRCPLCEELYAEWDKDEGDQDSKKIEALKSSWRCHYNAYDYDGESGEIELWDDQSYFLFEDILIEAMEADDEGLVTFWDLEDGRSIEYKTREKKIGKYPFHEAHSIAFHTRDPYGEDILEKVHPLDAMLIIPTEKDVLDAHLGSEGDEPQQSEATTETPAQGRRTRRIGGETQTPVTPEALASVPPAAVCVCPEGGIFGTDCNKLKACDVCDEKIYAACQEAFIAAQDEKGKQEAPAAKESNDEFPIPESSDIPPTRRRRRNA